MPRPRGRPARQPQQQTQQPSTSTPQKRALPAPNPTPTPTRQSKRLKSSPITTTSTTKTTPKKSQFFTTNDSEISEPESVVIEDEASGYEDEDASVTESEDVVEEEEENEDSESEEEEAARRTKRRKVAGGKATTRGNNMDTNNAASKKGQELWRPGVKSGLAPGEEVFIKLPKAREAGGTPYRDHTVHPNTMAFLGDLRENNEREWLKVHDADYRQSQKDFNSFVECLTEKVIEKDETIPELPSKDLTFRIYRDVRFSSDPTPYKTHYSAAWSRTGRKGPYAAYYLQIKPSGGSFLGAGLWQPDSAPLALMRQAIDRRSHLLKNILMQPGIRREFLKGEGKGGKGKGKGKGDEGEEEERAIKAFVEINKEGMLKTKPKGYQPDNKNLPLLRLRNFTLGRKLTDAEILDPDAVGKIGDLIEVLKPFVTYLNSVVMPDDNQDDDEEEGDDGDDDEEAGDEEREESERE